MTQARSDKSRFWINPLYDKKILYILFLWTSVAVGWFLRRPGQLTCSAGCSSTYVCRGTRPAVVWSFLSLFEAQRRFRYWGANRVAILKHTLLFSKFLVDTKIWCTRRTSFVQRKWGGVGNRWIKKKNELKQIYTKINTNKAHKHALMRLGKRMARVNETGQRNDRQIYKWYNYGSFPHLRTNFNWLRVEVKSRKEVISEQSDKNNFTTNECKTATPLQISSREK